MKRSTLWPALGTITPTMLGFLNRRLNRVARRRRSVADLRRAAGVDEAARRLLLYFVVPLWIGAGLSDWACHRRTNIAQTAGTRESMIHALQMAEAGIPTLVGLFFEINAGALAAILAGLGLHQATAAWDVAYAEDRRKVTPTEQHVHGLLEQVPVMATAFVVVMHWDQAKALLGSAGTPTFALSPKRQPLPRRYVRRLFAAITGLIVLPYAEELVRCLRHERKSASHTEP